VDCQIDQYETAPPQGWPRWMEEMIWEADFVLVVCTKSYADRVTVKPPVGVGRGAR